MAPGLVHSGPTGARQFPGILLFALVLLLGACSENYTPKPVGYHRLDLPEHSYLSFDKACPYSFDISESAIVKEVGSAAGHNCWYDIAYPGLEAELNLSFLQFESREELDRLISDTYKLSYKHTYKASEITEQRVSTKEAGGLIYRVAGNAASPLQFFMTDSTENFLRVSLYFNTSPNYDSLQPVIQFMDEEVLRLINSLHWVKK